MNGWASEPWPLSGSAPSGRAVNEPSSSELASQALRLLRIYSAPEMIDILSYKIYNFRFFREISGDMKRLSYAYLFATYC